jgi:hypothetical protein
MRTIPTIAEHEALRAKLRRAAQGRANKRIGAIKEALIAQRLRELGLRRVERREVGWRIQRLKGRVVGASPMGRVSGDFTAVAPGGIYVHVEAKHHSDPDAALSLSDFQKDGAKDRNQLDALDDYARLGCLSLVAWSSPRGVCVLLWPIPSLAKGAPLSWAAASILDLKILPSIRTIPSTAKA